MRVAERTCGGWRERFVPRGAIRSVDECHGQISEYQATEMEDRWESWEGQAQRNRSCVSTNERKFRRGSR